jgi:CRISPR system Cascade subunit CasD
MDRWAGKGGHMIDALVLRFDAPLMSFGGVAIDQHRGTRDYPGRSMITGLLGNALRYDHRQTRALQALQDRIEYAVREDRRGELLRDYQTVDLSQDFMQEGWTTRGVVQGRAGAKATREGTHIRLRDYLADAIYTVALTLDPAHADPDTGEVEAALRRPARPVFIGRKCCLPATPIFLSRVQTESLRAALSEVPLSPRAESRHCRIWRSVEGAQVRGALPVTDDRDWANQIHVGRRFVLEESIDV